jgi:hypothetical protein
MFFVVVGFRSMFFIKCQMAPFYICFFFFFKKALSTLLNNQRDQSHPSNNF